MARRLLPVALALLATLALSQADPTGAWRGALGPGLNHLMQPATTGGVEEYALIETTIDPIVLDRIADWLQERFPVR